MQTWPKHWKFNLVEEYCNNIHFYKFDNVKLKKFKISWNEQNDERVL